ncbi:MAG: hypothetical protein KGK07_17325 [Chloroflexota bacterium]|nr:hypothetical protein [Chloroflexota bacterium]
MIRRATAADLPQIAALWNQSPTNPGGVTWDTAFLAARGRLGDFAVVNDVPPINAAVIVQPLASCWHITEIMWAASLTRLQVTNALQTVVLPFLKAQRGAVPIVGDVSAAWLAFWQARPTAMIDPVRPDGSALVVDTG